MSLIDTAFDFAKSVANLVPGYGTAVSLGLDLAQKVWDIADPFVDQVVNNSNLSPELKNLWSQVS